MFLDIYVYPPRPLFRINLTLNGLARQLGLNGSVHMFGSFSNGFKTGTSDLDVVFVGAVDESAISILQTPGMQGIPCPPKILLKFSDRLDGLGFDNITKIFQANVPLLKLTDRKDNMEVDFCINNELGVRNSLLLNTYCKYDHRVLQLGRLVKEWAKKHELVGTADGCLNSYAYMLLVVFFLQQVQPPVVQNLQAMDCESVPVSDRKWGGEDVWETKFLVDVDSIPKSQNQMSIGTSLRFMTERTACGLLQILHARVQLEAACCLHAPAETWTERRQVLIVAPDERRAVVSGRSVRSQAQPCRKMQPSWQKADYRRDAQRLECADVNWPMGEVFAAQPELLDWM
eukprot:s966_g22.t1